MVVFKAPHRPFKRRTGFEGILTIQRLKKTAKNLNYHNDCVIILALKNILALVKQASDRRITDPAGTSHAKKKANVFRQIRVTKMSPQMSNLMIYGSTEPQISAEKQRFFGNFSFFGLSRR